MKILYGASWCPSCKTLKKQLEIKQVAFEYRDADDKEVMRELSDLGVRSIPFGRVGDKVFEDPTVGDYL